MSVFYESPATGVNPVWISPKSAARTGSDYPAFLSKSTDRPVMLVDYEHAFRQRLAAELRHAGVRVLQASGVYDALRLARSCELGLLVVAGKQRHQSGWLSAAKLCGQSPWRDVILHFSCVSQRDRMWGRATELAALVETRGQVEPLVESIVRHLRRRSPAALDRAVA